MKLEVIRQMYELAVRREEGRLTKKDKEILKMIEIPSSREVALKFQISLEKRDALNSLNDYVKGRRLSWLGSALRFVDLYYMQKEIGLNDQVEAIFYQWARKKHVPLKVISIITHHTCTWEPKSQFDYEKVVNE